MPAQGAGVVQVVAAVAGRDRRQFRGGHGHAVGRTEGDRHGEFLGAEAPHVLGQGGAVAAQGIHRVGPGHPGPVTGVAGVVGIDLGRRDGDVLTASGPPQPVDHQEMAHGDVVENHRDRPVLSGHQRAPLVVGAGLDEGHGLVVHRLHGDGHLLGPGLHPQVGAGDTATVTSISTAPPRGRAATPMADRV